MDNADKNMGCVVRPADMSDADWKKFCEERGLISVTGDQLKKLREKPYNRHQRRKFAALAKKANRA